MSTSRAFASSGPSGGRFTCDAATVCASAGCVSAPTGRTATASIPMDAAMSLSVIAIFSAGTIALLHKSTQGDPCENIVVTNCLPSKRRKPVSKLGTESRGPFRNIAVNNCVMRGRCRVFSLYMKDGGASWKNITGSQLIMDTNGPLSHPHRPRCPATTAAVCPPGPSATCR